MSCDYVREYVRKHPVKWMDRELTKHGGAGDSAGRTPYPCVEAWLRCLHEIGDMFDQKTYVDFCRMEWSEWWSKLTPLQQRGVTAKLANNYFPSMIDSLHAWALLSEARWFDTVTLDSYQDAIGKSDITCRCGMTETRIALFGPGQRALDARNYKIAHREGYDVQTVPVQMSWDRPVIGGKRWFELGDFVILKPEVQVKKCM